MLFGMTDKDLQSNRLHQKGHGDGCQQEGIASTPFTNSICISVKPNRSMAFVKMPISPKLIPTISTSI